MQRLKLLLLGLSIVIVGLFAFSGLFSSDFETCSEAMAYRSELREKHMPSYVYEGLTKQINALCSPN